MPEIGAPHKLTHQDGGNDEISVEGLAGDLADAQESTWARVGGKPSTFDPSTHASAHENAGADEIGVGGLSGLLGDSQTPLAHKTSHQDGGSDEISVAGLAGRQIFVPYNGKIADILEDDTDKHFLDLATPLGETRKIIAVLTGAERITGTGYFVWYPNEGARMTGWVSYANTLQVTVIANGTQRLQYAQTVANDDWDFYCFGYVVESA